MRTCLIDRELDRSTRCGGGEIVDEGEVIHPSRPSRSEDGPPQHPTDPGAADRPSAGVLSDLAKLFRSNLSAMICADQ